IFAWRNQRFLLHDCCNFCCIIVAKNVVFLFAKTAVLLNAVYTILQKSTNTASTVIALPCSSMTVRL
ncbi:hypothetical protein, partial [Petrimonas sp.]|uniref:hypothetical protein n=1 Tax=Petrimonas sp. TaxID=2023866 RepID=UPI003F51347C